MSSEYRARQRRKKEAKRERDKKRREQRRREIEEDKDVPPLYEPFKLQFSTISADKKNRLEDSWGKTQQSVQRTTSRSPSQGTVNVKADKSFKIKRRKDIGVLDSDDDNNDDNFSPSKMVKAKGKPPLNKKFQLDDSNEEYLSPKRRAKSRHKKSVFSDFDDDDEKDSRRRPVKPPPKSWTPKQSITVDRSPQSSMSSVTLSQSVASPLKTKVNPTLLSMQSVKAKSDFRSKKATVRANKEETHTKQATAAASIEDDDWDDDDFIQFISRNDKKRKLANIPRNPLREDEWQRESQELQKEIEASQEVESDSFKVAAVTKEPNHHSSSVYDASRSPLKQKESLWDDLSVEEQAANQKASADDKSTSIEEEKTRRKRKKKRHDMGDKEDEEETKVASKSNNRSNPSFGRRVQLVDDEESYVDSVAEDEVLKPEFVKPKMGPPGPLVPLELPYSAGRVNQVPAAINRYLVDYQRVGIMFLHSRIAEGNGAILGDDMGLGKTIQVIALVAALFGSQGNGRDLRALNRHRRRVQKWKDTVDRKKDAITRSGSFVSMEQIMKSMPPAPKKRRFRPVLIVVPTTVVKNWSSELQTWGHFAAREHLKGENIERDLERVATGLDEILVCTHGAMQDTNKVTQFMKIEWQLVILDEAHTFKNSKTKGYKGLKRLLEKAGCPVLSMTGTPMQNNHDELWCIVDMVQPKLFGDFKTFKHQYSMPIKYGRTKDAKPEVVRRGEEASQQVNSMLKTLMIRRNKKDVLSDRLPTKHERVIFCELTPIQKQIYQHVLTLPDFQLLLYANAPCECGVNLAIFQQYKLLRSDLEKLQFHKAKKDDITKRKKCCWKTAMNPDFPEFGEKAPLWRWQHPDGMECKNCPYCGFFPAITKLWKISSHASLLQVDANRKNAAQGTQAWRDLQKDLEFCRLAIPEDLLESFPGKDYFWSPGLMNEHTILSGKMKVLADLLAGFQRKDKRVLVFSQSTQALAMIECYVQSKGYSFLRLDGQTRSDLRQGLVDKFQNTREYFLFLISTKAGGLGLSLTAAQVVVVFDVEYNPANDEQAQDRAFRIGQEDDVLVIRLVSRGTIEELRYIRQIYKVQLKQQTMGNTDGGDGKKSSRLFRGVQQDKDRKGELFGVENMLKFKDGSFMDDIWKATTIGRKVKKVGKYETRTEDEMANAIDAFSQDQIENLCGFTEMSAFEEALANHDEASFKARNSNSDAASVFINRRRAQRAKANNVNEAAAKADGNEDLLDLFKGQVYDHGDFLEESRGRAAIQQGEEGFEEEMGGESQAVREIFDQADVQDADAEQAPSPVPSVVPSAPDMVSSIPVLQGTAPAGSNLPLSPRLSPVRSSSSPVPNSPPRRSWISARRADVKEETPFGTARSPFDRSLRNPTSPKRKRFRTIAEDNDVLVDSDCGDTVDNGETQSLPPTPPLPNAVNVEENVNIEDLSPLQKTRRKKPRAVPLQLGGLSFPAYSKKKTKKDTR